jgi:hypothetical protein
MRSLTAAIGRAISPETAADILRTSLRLSAGWINRSLEHCVGAAVYSTTSAHIARDVDLIS